MGVLLAMFIYLCLLLVVLEDLTLAEGLPSSGSVPHPTATSDSLSPLNDLDRRRLLRLWLLALTVSVLILKSSQKVRDLNPSEVCTA